MVDLTQEEKENYHIEMSQYLKILNEKINPFVGILHIGEVGYGIPIESNYFYFDYPYNSTVDILNEKASANIYLKQLINNVFDAFSRHQKNNKKDNVYIYYKYSISEDKKHFTLYQLDTNIEGSKEDIINYLSIAHFNIYTDSHYLATVELGKGLNPINGVKQILYVVKHLDNSIKKSKKNNRHLLTLTMYVKEGMHLELSYKVINFVYDVWIKILEGYFKSPIIKKILLDNRRREVLSYQHNIYNLRLPVEMGNLQDAIAKTENENLKSKVFDLHRRYKILRLMLFFTFKVESFKSSGWEKFPLAGINICDIIEYFSKELTPPNINVHCNYDSNICNNKIPSRKYLSDITQVLWNLWANAVTQSLKPQNKTFYIDVSMIDDNVQICLQNDGVIPIEYYDYININDSDYPVKVKEGKQYKGLQIVKFICSENDWSIQCQRNIFQRKTKFKFILNKDVWKL